MRLAEVITARTALAHAIGSLRRAGIRGARFEASLLLAHAVGESREWVLSNPNERLSAVATRRFTGLVRRRRSRFPIQYLLGEWPFWNDTFRVGEGVLIPRPESEHLVEAAAAWLGRKAGTAPRVLELGVGSGAVLLSILRECPRAEGWGVDISWRAVKRATENASRLGLAARVRLWVGDLAGAVAGREKFDLVVFNPPYLTCRELRRAQPELGFEPPEALDGGVGGLAFYDRAADELPCILKPEGRLLLEVSPRRAGRVRKLLDARGWKDVRTSRDLAGRDRVVDAASSAWIG
ncbi:MAG: peptide chain release factor N(5)-glutamine methyltransferase [Nitrospirae bacterium]|nr:peptide chain release factor N(5)-glutamine methyltransferase [Nitrospirota bacterium]